MTGCVESIAARGDHSVALGALYTSSNRMPGHSSTIPHLALYPFVNVPLRQKVGTFRLGRLYSVV